MLISSLLSIILLPIVLYLLVYYEHLGLILNTPLPPLTLFTIGAQSLPALGAIFSKLNIALISLDSSIKI